MYTIYADNVCIFDDTAPDKAAMAANPELSLSAGAAGSLRFTLVPGGVGYDAVHPLTTTLRVERDGGVIWMGRALVGEKAFAKTRSLMCEGALAWLNDFVIPQGTASGTAAQLLDAVLGTYNTKASDGRRIVMGTVTVAGSDLTLETDYCSALEAVNRLVSDYGGVLRMRYPADGLTGQPVPTLDWLADYPASAAGDQGIEFGENLLDFTVGWDLTDYATAAIVRGAEYETTVGDTTVKSNYMGSAELPNAIRTYGRIEKFLSYPDCDSAARCSAAALDWLQHQFDTMRLELTALDLHILNPDIRAFDLLQRVPVSSWPHDFSDTFALIGLDIPLYAAENTRYILGSANATYKRRLNTLTQKQQAAEQQLSDRVAEEHAYTEAGLDDARDYADGAASAAQTAAEQTAAQALSQARSEIDAVITSVTSGYVTVETSNGKTQGIYISEGPDYTTSQKLWRFTMGGLAYSNNGLNGPFETAINMNGQISAKFILTDEMWSDRIKLFGDMAVYNAKNAAYPSGYIGYGPGNNGYDWTSGIHMYTGTNREIIVTDYGARMSFDSTSFYINGQEAVANCDMYAVGFYPTSDRNAKKNIEYDPEKYAKLFDLLRPCSFEYKKTDPGMRHTGFIAQDIEAVLADAGLTPEDFGGLRKREVFDPITKETRTEYSLSYNDLVPLCVDQIQRLKQRVKELEA